MTGQRMIAIFLAGVLLLNYPLLYLFSSDATLLGIPLLFVYVFVAWFVLRKMIRISRLNRITSIADFVASRYGKSHLLGGLVTIIAVIGVVPYIALQLKAVSASVDILLNYPAVGASARGALAAVQDH